MTLTKLGHTAVSHASSGLQIGTGLRRLLTAAVVNREFCNLLLANPAMAVATGYNGEPFDLAVEEQELIYSIRATSLTDFAEQITNSGNGNGHIGHNQKGNGYGYKSHVNGGIKGKVSGRE